MHRSILVTVILLLLLACNLTGGPATKPTRSAPGEQATTSGPGSAQTQSPVSSSPTETPPPLNPAFPVISVELQAIRVSDDNGSRAARITPQQVTLWVGKANEIFAKASVRLVFDPGSDFTTVKSTLLNDMTGDTDAMWKNEVDFGDQIAAQHSGKAVVFFIHGPDQPATGGGFSSSDYNFVEAPGFNDTTVCGYQNIGLLAHELGHYFGLSHPFAQEFSSLQEAESYLSAHGNDPSAFDGDGLSDTPPDPFIRQPQYQCNPKDSITLNGKVFPLPRLNIMSYYSTSGVDRTDLTPQQIAIVRWIAAIRQKNEMGTPVDNGLTGAVDFADLPITNSSNVQTSVQDMSGFGDVSRWTGDKQLFATAQPGGSIDFRISVKSSGNYAFDLYATTAPDYGIVQTLLDGSLLGAPVDLYAPIVLPSGKIPVGTVELTAGSHTLSFRVTGRNSASSNTSFGLNAFSLAPGG